MSLIWNIVFFIYNSIIYYIKSLSIIGVVIILSWWVVKLFFGWRKYKKALKLNHSKDLVKELRVNSEVVFSQKDISFKLQVEPYSKEINEHLEDGYKDIHEIILRRDFYIDKLHNAELHEFLNKLNSKIMDELTQKSPTISEWDEFSEQPKPKKYYTKYLKSEVGAFVQFRYENYYTKRDPFALNIGKNGIWNELKLVRTLVASDDDKEIQEIREMIIKNFNVAINSNWFKLLMWYLDNIREYHTEIKEKLNKIIKDAGSDISLEGKCKKCPKEDSLLEYTWQCIKKFLPWNET